MSSQATASSVSQVNTYTTSNQRTSAITALDNGGWVVTWESYDQDVQYGGIFQQRYSATGKAVGAETMVNTQSTNAQTAPAICGLADGGWVVAWNSHDANLSGVYMQRYDSSGNTFGTETLANEYATSGQQNPSIALLDDGGWVVTWDGAGAEPDSVTGIFQRHFNKSGQAVGGDIHVNTTTTNAQADASVIGLKDGGWVTVWTSSRQDDPINTGIYQQAFDADGKKVHGEVHVNTFTNSYQTNAEITALNDGGWVVVWQSAGNDKSGYGIFQQRYNSDGVAVGGETQVNTYTANNQVNPSVATLSGGGWIVVWDGVGAGDVGGIYQQRYNANGKMVGGETLVNTYTTDQQSDASVTALDGGDWVVSWTSRSQDGDVDGIFQRHFAADVRGNGKANTLIGTLWDQSLFGLGGHDSLSGKAGRDILDGGKGADTLSGGTGADQFVFKTGYGHETITDFDFKGADHDILDLRGLKGLAGFSDLKTNHMSQDGGDVVIDMGHRDIVTIEGVKVANLHAEEFFF